MPTHNVEVSEVSTVPMLKSQKSQLWQCHNVQVSESRSGPKSTKMVRNGVEDPQMLVQCISMNSFVIYVSFMDGSSAYSGTKELTDFLTSS